MTHILKLPNGLAICASALLCAAVVALQNADVYAAKLESPIQSLSSFLLHLPDDLRKAGAVTLATELNSLEKTHIAGLSSVLSTEETVEDASAEAELPAEAPAAAAVPPSAEPVEQEPAAPVAQAPSPAEPAEGAPAMAADPLPAEPAAVAVEPPAPEPLASVEPLRETLPLVRSQWRSLLAVAMPSPMAGAARTSAGRFSASAAEPPPAPAAAATPQESPAAQTPPPPVQEPAPAAEPPAEPLPAVAPPVSVEESGLTQAPPMRYRIMLVGDSLMEDLGPRTHKAFNRRKGLDFVVSAKYSTGLCRPDFFNWPNHMREQVSKRRPDLVIFFIGANDGLSVKEGKRLVPTGGQAWREAYGRKMDELISIARDAGAEVIWVELPAVGGRYNKLLHETQIAQREFCESRGIATLQTDPLLSGVWGKFEIFGTYKGKTVRLRRTDDTHLTPDGNMKVLEALQPMIEQRLISFYLAHPERHLSEEEVKKIKSVPAVYTCQYTPPKKKTADKPAAAQPQQ